MIEINLVPPELKKKKKNPLLGGFKMPLEIVIGSVGGLILLLFIVHIALLFLNITKLAIHKSLKNEWEDLAPSKKNVDDVINEMREIQNSQKSLEKIIGEQKISWAEKLNIISDSMPRGLWLKQITLTQENLKISGSAISKMADEMINVHKFTSNLKQHETFMNLFEDLELGSIQRRTINITEIADFSITITYNKPKPPEPEEKPVEKKKSKAKKKTKAKAKKK